MNENLDATIETEDKIVMPAQLDANQQGGNVSDSSPDSGDNHEEKHNGVQDRINKITAEKYQAQREKDELKKQLDELQAQSAKPETPSVSIDEPVIPADIYDEDAMRKYYADSAKYNREVAAVAAQSTFERQQKDSVEQASKAKQNEVLQGYANNAVRDGVDMEKLRIAEQAINQAGINQQLAEYIMKDANGAKIVETLYDNPALMHEVIGMDPISAGMKIANEVKPMALSKTPKVSNAPTPPTEIKGGGVIEQDEFDTKYPGAQFI